MAEAESRDDAETAALKEFAESIRLKFRNEAILARDESYRRGYEKGQVDRGNEIKYQNFTTFYLDYDFVMNVLSNSVSFCHPLLGNGKRRAKSSAIDYISFRILSSWHQQNGSQC